MDALRAFLKFLFLVIIFPPLVYLVAVIIGAVIPVNSNPTFAEPFTEIYLVSNGMHTDFILPVKTEVIDWTEVVGPEQSLSPPKDLAHISFGWGDLEFYRNTPQWKDLNIYTGLRALFKKTPSALHVRFIDALSMDKQTRRIVIDRAQYEKLSSYIKETFYYNAAGKPMKVDDLHYFKNDIFYRAKGSLHLFKTCNTWVNSGLKRSGLKACLWTPFVEGIFLQYSKNEIIKHPAAAFSKLDNKVQD